MVSLIALAVVLIAGGAVGVSFLLRNKNDQSGMGHSRVWSSTWLEGHEKVRNLESPSHGKAPSIRVVDDKLIHITDSSATGSTTLTVFKLGDGGLNSSGRKRSKDTTSGARLSGETGSSARTP